MTLLPSAVGLVSPRIAVLIDGDNIPRSFRPEIDRHAKQSGNVAICQLFGDITLHSDWSKEAGIDIHHCIGKPGSNAADIALVIAALDLAYRGLAQSFLIVSNDRDFAPLLRHLTKIGCTAAILGTPQRAPLAVAVAVPLPVVQPTAQIQSATTKPPAKNSTILTHVKELILTQGGADGLAIARLGSLHSKTGFRVSDTPSKTWRAWLEARPKHFELDPRGPDSRVRLVSRQTG